MNNYSLPGNKSRRFYYFYNSGIITSLIYAISIENYYFYASDNKDPSTTLKRNFIYTSIKLLIVVIAL
jgi:hypothetical protein